MVPSIDFERCDGKFDVISHVGSFALYVFDLSIEFWIIWVYLCLCNCVINVLLYHEDLIVHAN